jgi:hypothetical protein
MNYLPRLALDYDTPDLSLPRARSAAVCSFDDILYFLSFGEF